ncbi:MAG: YjgN family protein [Bacteroidota bacterium]|nr:YjgN family protein [Bacteroidota bacterium]
MLIIEFYTEPKKFTFHGKKSNYFELQVANWVLTAVTLGFYYPWAKANKLRYLYQKTEFGGSRFTFHGTGKEMFKGYLKAIVIFIMFYAIVMGISLSGNPELVPAGIGVIYLGLALLIPVALHGSMRYRASRSSWRGIHFGYRGSLKRLYGVYFLNLFLTLFSFGIYTPWFVTNLRKEIIGNLRFGDAQFSFEGSASEFFMILLKGHLLTIPTFGVYYFFMARDLYKHFVNNIFLHQNGEYAHLETNITGWGLAKLEVVNLLILIFTVGLGAPLVTVRTMRYIFANTELEGFFDPDGLIQTEEQYQNATYEDVADMLDLNLV